MKTALALLAATLVATALLADERIDRLTPEQRTWLEQDAVYLITDIEKESFLDIEASDVRNAFIDAFWKRRDPNPATLENEFKVEHYRRMDYANDVLSRETARPGWRTDRGRYYIVLGEPRGIQRYNRDNITPLELWFYETDTTRGLPPFFYLLFFQRRSFGEFELYDPSADGPRALVQGGVDRIGDNRAALETLREINIEVARAALSFDPSERGYADAETVFSGATNILLANIDEAPKRNVRTDYIRGWERYGGRVDADYSFNFVTSRATFAVLVGAQDTAFVHYSIEIDPQNFNLETDEENSRYYTVVDLGVEVRTLDGALVVDKQREIFFQLTPTEFESVQTSPVAIQGTFPLVSGEHNVSIIAKNRVLKQYTVAERDLQVGRVSSDVPGLTDLVLGYERQLVAPGNAGEVRPFQVEGQLLRPAADGVFALGESAFALSQAYGAGPDHRVRFTLVSTDETLDEWEFSLARYQGGAIEETLPLGAIETAGNYELRMALLAPDGGAVAERSTPLLVSPRTAVSRAGYLSREGFNGAAPGLLALERAEQLLGLGRYDEGVAELENAVAADNPDLPMARWKLAAIRIESGDADGTLELLTPLEASHPDQFEVVAGLGFAHYYKQEFAKGQSYLEQALSLRPPYPALLNSLADCYERSGQSQLALETFERSLELESDQPVVQERVATLRPAKN